MNDFFKKQTEPEPNAPETPETIKIGEKEYTQDQLSELVGLGELTREVETKTNRKIDQFWPDYTRKSQRLTELETENQSLKEAQKQKVENKLDTTGLTEEQKIEARKQIFELIGDEPLTKKEFETQVNQKVNQILGARDLIEATEAVIEDAVVKGLPKTTVEELLKHMDENGFKNPIKAYKDLYEVEIDKWKEGQLAKIKNEPITTDNNSTAGGKSAPQAVRPTKDNLEDLYRSHFRK